MRKSTSLSGKYGPSRLRHVLGRGNIFAGSLSMGTFGENAADGPPTTFTAMSPLTLRAVKAPALWERFTPVTDRTGDPRERVREKRYPEPGKVHSRRDRHHYRNKRASDVDGAGATTTNVVFKRQRQPSRKDVREHFQSDHGIRAIWVLKGKNCFQKQRTLTLNSGAKLDLQKNKRVNLTSAILKENDGFVFLGQNQNWRITEAK